MAQRGRQQELFALAIANLRTSGYSFSVPSRGRFGRNVRVLTGQGESEIVLIQTRSHQPDTSRYLVGIMVADLERVDQVVLYFEGEDRYLKVPAAFLRGIHSRMRERGLARYTGAHDQQWRVDVHISSRELSPQGSDGERYDISEYLCRVPMPVDAEPGDAPNLSGIR